MIRMVERKQKGKSILTYILIPFCALIIVEAFVFIGILVLSGIRGQMEKNAYDIVKERVSTRKTDLQSDMLVSWTDIDELQIYINETVSKLSDEGKINLEHMDDDSEAAEPLLSAVADNMRRCRQRISDERYCTTTSNNIRGGNACCTRHLI